MTNNTSENTATPAASCLSIVQAAINQPGIIHEAYHRFHGYSLRNQLLAILQCITRGIAPGPLSTFRGWERVGRHVLRGQKAIVLCVPITHENADADAIDENTKVRFVFRSRWFVLGQTEGAAYAPIAVPTWQEEHALKALGVKRVAFDHPDGNVQGYATDDGSIAISPVAGLPHKTLFHELAHVLLDHGKDQSIPRAVREVEAEGVALFCCEALGLDGAVYARGYINNWLGKEALTETMAQRIMSTAHCILSAGRLEEPS